jgi:hypothetical protein
MPELRGAFRPTKLLLRFASFARLVGLRPLKCRQPDFSRVRWGPHFGDETPGFCHMAMSQVLSVQALAKFACDKMGRILVKTPQ